jgi:hypothetical protein
MKIYFPDNTFPFINDSDVNNSFSANKANLFPILPSTVRDSRYRDNVHVRVLPAIVPLGTYLSACVGFIRSLR